jgi:UDP:flavonoid glycosyltransferase YjiC (YdhE family)
MSTGLTYDPIRELPIWESGYRAGVDTGLAAALTAITGEMARQETAAIAVATEFLPQTNILPLVDLVITHGGNNTTTEAMHFGTPMIVLPLFWDQYDNAARVHETGHGIRLDTYRCTADQLADAISSLLDDHELGRRSTLESTAIRSGDGVRRAADLIEEVATSRR